MRSTPIGLAAANFTVQKPVNAKPSAVRFFLHGTGQGFEDSGIPNPRMALCGDHIENQESASPEFLDAGSNGPRKCLENYDPTYLQQGMDVDQVKPI